MDYTDTKTRKDRMGNEVSPRFFLFTLGLITVGVGFIILESII